jgi:hypothetical protein
MSRQLGLSTAGAGFAFAGLGLAAAARFLPARLPRFFERRTRPLAFSATNCASDANRPVFAVSFVAFAPALALPAGLRFGLPRAAFVVAFAGAFADLFRRGAAILRSYGDLAGDVQASAR